MTKQKNNFVLVFNLKPKEELWEGAIEQLEKAQTCFLRLLCNKHWLENNPQMNT